MTDTPTPTNKSRRWLRIAGIFAVPVLTAALLVAYVTSTQPAASADDASTETTTTTTSQSPLGESAGSFFDEGNNSEPWDFGNNETPPADEPPMDEEEPVEEEEPIEEEEDHPPVPAVFDAPTEVNVTPGGNASIKLSNLGEVTLDVLGVSTNGFPIEVLDVPGHVDGYSDEMLTLKVNTGELANGPYSLTVTVSTDVGNRDIEVKGIKLGLVAPTVADLDFEINFVAAHNQNLVLVVLTNNEDYEVEIEFASSNPRLSMASSLTLVPGDNLLAVTIQPWALPWNQFQILQLTATWDSVSVPITIMKWGS